MTTDEDRVLLGVWREIFVRSVMGLLTVSSHCEQRKPMRLV